MQHSDNFAPNSFLQQLKTGSYSREDYVENLGDRCLTTTAATAPQGLLSDSLTTALNSVKNQAMQQRITWDTSTQLRAKAGASANKDPQPTSLKRRESSTNKTAVPSVTYSGQAGTSQPPNKGGELHILANKQTAAAQPT